MKLDVSTTVGDLQRQVSRAAEPLVERHAGRLQCKRGCHACCVDELTVFEVEAERIRAEFATLLRDEAPHPGGACAFLDGEGGCRIYDARPYVCRTQGLPLRWLGEHEGHTVEYRDICPLNEVEGEPLQMLDASACWTLGETEGQLAQLQQEHGNEPLVRIALRDLFKS